MALPIEDRLVRLEEGQGFAEHTVEQLNAELVEVNRRLAEAMARLDRVEQRLAQLQAPAAPDASEDAGQPPGGDPPPHW